LPNGIFDLYAENWNPAGTSPALLHDVHSFEWLRDLRRCNGSAARTHAQTLTESWLSQYYDYHPDVWHTTPTARRISMWISHAELFDFDEDMEDVFLESLFTQAKHLYNQATAADHSALETFAHAKALIYAGMALGHNQRFTDKGLGLLSHALDAQILNDGCHISRAPDFALCILQTLLDIRVGLNAAGATVPETLQNAIAAMTPALRLFRHNDKAFAMFAGTQKGYPERIDSILAQSGSKTKSADSLPDGGYDRIANGQGVLIMDTGLPQDSSSMNTAPLALEFSYGKDRLLTSCGAHPFDPAWQGALATSGAHNTLTIEDENPAPIEVTCTRQDHTKGSMIEASHDGYSERFGVKHSRMVYLGDLGRDLRGEDTLEMTENLPEPLNYALRFHLHPRANVSLVRYGTEALVTLKGRSGKGGGAWRFCYDGGHLALEDSVYIAHGTQIRKTQQLVIYGQICANTAHDITLKWRLFKDR
jgi:uncharacterized heparinase superfamily protein